MVISLPVKSGVFPNRNAVISKRKGPYFVKYLLIPFGGVSISLRVYDFAPASKEFNWWPLGLCVSDECKFEHEPARLE